MGGGGEDGLVGAIEPEPGGGVRVVGFLRQVREDEGEE